MSNGCTKLQTSSECQKTQTLNGWKIELTAPTDITQPATTFQYVITRVDPE